MKLNLLSIIIDVLLAAVTGFVAATAIVPFSVIALIVLLVAVATRTRTRHRREQNRLAVVGATVAVLVFGSIIAAAAYYSPAKTVEQQVQREVVLPYKSMILAELAYLSTNNRNVLPIRTSFCFAEADKNMRVEWPEMKLTLGEFLAAIEAQTGLRHKFRHCGNGYTVLRGGDCCFGLYVRDPELAVPPFPRERFDLDVYAAEHANSISPSTVD